MNKKPEVLNNNNFTVHADILQILHNNTINLGRNHLKLKKSWHKNLNKIYLGERNDTIILDYKFTYIYLIKAICVYLNIIKANGNILIINTNSQLSPVMYHVKKNNKNKNVFFSDKYYSKGTLTNSCKIFNKIKTFINFYHDYNSFLNENNIHFPGYKKMKKNYKGFINYNTDNVNSETLPYATKKTHTYTRTHQNIQLNANWKPDLLVFTDIENNDVILKEASALNIPTIAFVDSNYNKQDVTYRIPINIQFIPVIWLFFTLATKISNKLNKK